MIGEAWLLALGLCGTLLFLAGVLHIPINALTAAAHAHAEAAAREEVRLALEEFWAAQGKAPPPADATLR